MPEYRHHDEATIPRSLGFTYFLFAAFSGAGFQLGMFGVRKLALLISKSQAFGTDYWREPIQSSFYNLGIYLQTKWIKCDHVVISKCDKEPTKTEKEVTIDTKEKMNEQSTVIIQRKRNVSIESYNSLLNQQSVSSTTPNSEKRYLELLVHNVAHTDLVLSLGDLNTNSSSSKSNRKKLSEEIIQSDDGDDETNIDLTICKPRFSAFSFFSDRIYTALIEKSKETKLSSISFPRYERKDTPRYTLVTPRPSRQISTPLGFNLTNSYYKKHLNVNTNDLSSLRLRGRDYAKITELDDIMKSHQEALEKERISNDDSEASTRQFSHSKSYATETQYYLNAIFFPLLSTLMARWEESMTEKYSSGHNVKKVILLVTGVGTPRNWTHSISGNSTKSCAAVMEIFLNMLYPDVTVVKIHSETNIFRYDENILFTKQELVPVIDSYRDAHARNLPYPDELKNNPDSLKTTNKYHPFDPDWKKTFHVTLSFADGAPARTHAIQAALRAYRPTYFHIWQLKTFWHETKITSDDIEVHAFEEMETTPPMNIDDAADRVQYVTKEMLKFKEEYVRQILSEENDIDEFWLRKSKKPVLAVLAVKKRDTGDIVLYRGTNMEVSMPTGSLCAERNVIGTALATNPGLKREDLLMVAVLAVPFEDIYEHLQQTNNLNSEESDGINVENLNKREGMRRSMSVNSFASIVEEKPLSDEDGDWIQTATAEQKTARGQGNPEKGEAYDLTESIVKIPPLNLEPPNNIPSVTPLRRIRIYSNTVSDTDGGEVYCRPAGIENPHTRSNLFPKKRRGRRRTVVIHSNKDINPLKPCGACNEWLKKIAESNPYFKVLTFTDADCKGVYVNSCQE